MIPKHIAIIPDGNRRWARAKGLLPIEGHRFAAEKILPDLIKKSAELGISYVTFWVLSTENIQERTKAELNNLFYLIRYLASKKLTEFKRKGVKVLLIGDATDLPAVLQKDITKVVRETKNNKKITLILAINYGGKDEIIRAIKRIQDSGFGIQNLTKEKFGDFLDTKGIPDPDLIIRTGGEERLSGFMLWQSEYSEFYFSDKYFPDFNGIELEKAVNDYSLRQRRFGK